MVNRTLTLEEIKKIELEILIDLDKFCRENDITYYLTGGTLLGAVRHKGFIPWDDDVDVFMTRDNYNKFLNKYSSDKYRITNAEKTEGYYWTYTKIEDCNTVVIEKSDFYFRKEHGLWIDIFPLDSVTLYTYKKRYKACNRLNSMLAICEDTYYMEKSIMGWIKHFISFLVGKKRILKLLNKEYLKCNGDYKMCLSLPSSYRNLVFKEELVRTVDLEFENHLFMCPCDYIGVLEKLYGDWKKLPPPENRTGHILKAMIKN